jgi:hypothetical protein
MDEDYQSLEAMLQATKDIASRKNPLFFGNLLNPRFQF